MSLPEAHPETQPESHPGAGPVPGRTHGPRLTTVLSVVGVGVLVLALLGAVVPSVRDQLRLSLTRQDAPYVETWFASVDQARTCNDARSRFRTTVAVRSHLDRAEEVPVVLTLVPRRGGATTTTESSVRTVPGEVTQVEVAARKPRGAYSAQVTFPGRDQQLEVHCARSRP